MDFCSILFRRTILDLVFVLIDFDRSINHCWFLDGFGFRIIFRIVAVLIEIRIWIIDRFKEFCFNDSFALDILGLYRQMFYIYMRYLININWLIKFLNLNFSILVPNVKLKILILCSSLFLFVSINFNKFHSF